MIDLEVALWDWERDVTRFGDFPVVFFKERRGKEAMKSMKESSGHEVRGGKRLIFLPEEKAVQS